LKTIFHQIIDGEIPAEKLHEDDLCIAIKDVDPVAEEHYLVIPKQTIPDLQSAGEEDKQLMGHLMLVAAKLTEGRDFRLVAKISPIIRLCNYPEIRVNATSGKNRIAAAITAFIFCSCNLVRNGKHQGS